MEDKESGSLSQKSVLDLIVELYRGTVTGSLKLERAPLQKAVYFREGQILFAASNDPKDQLASILVEEGKLGPDQMQVAQARVSSGNPLAKVLTELGYISQRELADAARIKVEKILTDLYSWNEGTYQFATKSLPKGAIDLDLSTTQLIFASVGRIQNREWILAVLGSLDVALGPGSTIDDFIVASKADPAAVEVLRHADGTKTVTEIGAMSSLGEFEVCKILAAGLVIGALTKSAEAAVPAAVDDAFSIPSEPPAFDPGPQLSEVPFGGGETVGLDTNPTPVTPPGDDPFQVPPRDDTVFQPPPQEYEEPEKTVFEAPPGIPGGLPLEPPPPPLTPPPEPAESPVMSFGAPNATASELLIDEPEPDEGDEDSSSSTRMPPRPKGRQGGGSSGNLVGILKIAGVVALAAGAAFSVYFFVWPMFAGGSGDGSAPTETASGTAPPPAASSTAPVPAGTDPAPPTTDPRAAGTNPAPRPAPAQPTPAPAPTTTPSAAQPAPTPPPATTSTRRGPSPPPRTPTQPSGGGGDGRQLLVGGDISGAANAFSRELGSASRNMFTVAVGLYCNEDNVGRVVQNARGAAQLYVLPTTVQGRKCFRVVWGTYDTRQAAEQAMGSVPNGIRAGDSAAVPIASVLR